MRVCVCVCVCVFEFERARTKPKFPFCIGNHKTKACIVSSSDTKSVLSPEREREIIV